MKIKINAKSNSCNCQSNAGSGCTNKHKDEAPIDKWFAGIGITLLFGAIALHLWISVDTGTFSWRTNLTRTIELLGIMFFGVAMARWRG